MLVVHIVRVQVHLQTLQLNIKSSSAINMMHSTLYTRTLIVCVKKFMHVSLQLNILALYTIFIELRLNNRALTIQFFGVLLRQRFFVHQNFPSR